ncbi:uncharacterized protein STEHIDRAFT_125827 [Stereum hirsutum FP-91666 SS1]|uniref:uncharacterized protein n=1 Tax=Stereum hirsutum (strain FP-91666) TaxID=721885 RepID=UPI0004449E0C|nr:uncharacterized protein STEHIDRAFT_125827 [Stereum hirsutum FP-91666 SS1]EIM80865.1 hypothetical protein STEHIDRAFT_125827 [Stereum hirsutum FP-91666 SS1]
MSADVNWSSARPYIRISLQIDHYDDQGRWPGIAKPGQSMWRSHTETEKKDVLSHRPLARQQCRIRQSAK